MATQPTRPDHAAIQEAINHFNVERYLALHQEMTGMFTIPEGSMGPAPMSGREVQMRQEAAMARLRFNLGPGDIISYEPIRPIDQDRIFARKKIGGKLYRKEVAWMNEHGFVVCHELKKSEKCMAVVKNDSMVPDWNWQAMQKGEKWCKPITPWQWRCPQ